MKIVKFLKNALNPAWVFIAFVIVAILVFFTLQKTEPLVIFAGGGSVKKYLLESSYKLDVEKYGSNSLYINIPSEDGWTLLKEEIVRFKNDISKHPFLFICLSAASMDNSIEYNREKAYIYGYQLGKDTLAVYFNNMKEDEGDTISIEKLKDHLENKENKYKIYITSQKSGTRRAYDEALKGKVDLKSIHTELFFDTDDIYDTSIILGSNYYPPNNYSSENPNLTKKFVCISGKVVTKPLYIYFVAYKKEGKYIPDGTIIDFLNKLNKGVRLDEITWKEQFQPTSSDSNIKEIKFD